MTNLHLLISQTQALADQQDVVAQEIALAFGTDYIAVHRARVETRGLDQSWWYTSETLHVRGFTVPHAGVPCRHADAPYTLVVTYAEGAPTLYLLTTGEEVKE